MAAKPRISRNPAIAKSRIPGFLVEPERRFAGWRDALATFWLPEPAKVPDLSAQFSHNLIETRARLPKRALLSSFLLHFFAYMVLLRIPMALYPERYISPRSTEAPVIYYDLGLVHFLKMLPTIKSPGPGGKPGVGHIPNRPPAVGSTVFHPKFTIVSNPPRPDNKRQTIIQPASPPELRIRQDLALPTVLIGNPLAIPKPKLELHLRAPRNAPVRPEPKVEPPTLKVFAVPSDFPVTLAPATNDSPHLPVPLPSAMLAAAHAPEAKQAANQGAGEQTGDPTAAGGLLVVGVDPSGVAHLLGLPPGNRYGEFSISPAGGQPGSPGGVPGGVPGGGTGGAGTGGDGSSGVGPGHSGGGGGGSESGAAGGLSITGGGGTEGGVAGSLGTLTYSASNTAAMPTIALPQVRKNALLVFTGPIGGGGLGVYGALRGGKIYSMFLSMPGKNWVLQYCLAEKAVAKPAPGAHNVTVQLDQGLAPPQPVERFDFERVPVPEEKANKLIVLQGVIRTDGSVGDLKLYRGVQAEMDQAALAAFGRWKFKPALRANQPVAVDILVGIPARLPKS